MSQEDTSTEDSDIEEQEEQVGDDSVADGSPGDASIPRFEFSVDKGKAAQELLRLRAEHPEYYQTIAAQIGQKSANRYRREIRELDVELAEIRKQLRWNEIRGMAPEEVQKQFDSDPKFAVEYAELSHYQPQQAQATRQPSIESEQAQINEALQDLWGEARAAGIQESVLQETAQAMLNGKYGAEGEEHWTSIVGKMALDLGKKMAQPQRRTQERVQEETPAVTQTNSNLLRGSGDVTRTGGAPSAGASFPKTLDEYKKLPAKQRMSLIESDAGEAALDKLLLAAQRSK